MISIGSAFVVVKQLELDDVRSKYETTKSYEGESRFAEVYYTSANGIYLKGDIVSHEGQIMYYPATDLGDGLYYIRELDINAKVKNGVFFSTRESVYIKTDKHANQVKKYGDLKIEVDGEYTPYRSDIVVQHGEVISKPLIATNTFTGSDKNIPIEIEEGDVVYTHHFLTHPDNERMINGEVVYEIRYEDCYFKRTKNREIVMLNEWNLLEPIEVDERKTIGKIELRQELEKDGKKAVVKHLSKKLESIGVKKEDVVVFESNMDYPIHIDDKVYYRVNTRNILAIN